MIVKGISIINNKPQVSSLIIAEQLDKKHHHVTEKIRKVLTPPEYWERDYKYGNNNIAKEYILDKDAFILLVMNYEGFNDFKRAYIKRFNEMETELRRSSEVAIPQSFSEALQLAADQAKQLELQAPKVEFYDAVTKSNDYMTMKEVANILNIPELGRNNLLKRLRELKVLTKFNKPYQKYVNSKYFKAIESKVDTYKGVKVFTSTVVSQKGLDFIRKQLSKDFK